MDDDVTILEYDEDLVFFGFDIPDDRFDFIMQWINGANIEGHMFQKCFFFKRIEDRNTLKLML